MIDIYKTLYELEKAIRKKDNEIAELYKIIGEQKEQLENKDNNNLSYSIDKSVFVSCMEALKEFDKYVEKLKELGLISIYHSIIDNVVSSFRDLLSRCVNDTLNRPEIYSDLSYFINDLNWGEHFSYGYVKDKYGNNVDISSIEAMWEYFKNKNKEVSK